jgi:hypothetical protein
MPLENENSAGILYPFLDGIGWKGAKDQLASSCVEGDLYREIVKRWIKKDLIN